MKVCFLNDSFPPVIDGVVNVLLNYAEYMRRDHGAEIIVGTPEYPDADYSAYEYPVVAYPSFDTADVTNGYRTGNPLSGKEISRLAAFQPDIIHTHCPASATVIARILREQTGAPVIYTYHTKYDIDIRRYVKNKTLADQTIRAMVSNIEACDEIWVVSRGAGESLKGLGFQGDFRVMNNGVDFAKGRADEEAVDAATAGYDLPDGIPVFLYVGRLITYKGLPLILEALKILDEAGQDFRMVFVGKGPDRELLEQRAAELGIGGKCIFTGPVYDRDVLRAWNTRADLFLFPSTFDTNGLVVREAAACGLASVLIRDSCAAEGITDGRNGFTIDETPESMAELLKKVCGNIPHLKEVGQHAMDEIYLSWQECVSEAYRRYEEVLELKARGLLPARQKDPTDYLVSFTAHRMQSAEDLRQFLSQDGEQLKLLGDEWGEGMRHYKAGMMDNNMDPDGDAGETSLQLAALSEKLREQYAASKARRKELAAMARQLYEERAAENRQKREAWVSGIEERIEEQQQERIRDDRIGGV
ncbi:MAG: glycosyltransferase [Lachnospiraceae bacterium]|nr:glycosyltransferase [Lachnospiraceae bacterium]